MVYRSPDDDGFDMPKLQAESAKDHPMRTPADVELVPLIFDKSGTPDTGCGWATLIILSLLLMSGVLFWPKNHKSGQSESKLTTEEALLVEICEYDYIVINDVSYPTKDISEIDTKDYPNLTMKLNDFQYVVKFDAHHFILRNEGCSYGDTAQ